MKRIYLLLLGIGIIFVLTGCTDSTENKKNEPATQKQEETTEKEQVDNIYQDDEVINLLINKYNKNNEDKITSDMLTKKHIGGRDRDDVVVVSNDKLEIILYNDTSILDDDYKVSVYVGYTNTNETIDDYKKQFITFIKLFDESLSNDEIDYYWNDLTSAYHSTYEINDIDIVCQTNVGTITYFKLTSKIEF